MKRPATRHLLEELVYECLRQYALVWDAALLAGDLAASIERVKQELADRPAEQEALVTACSRHAWRRLREHCRTHTDSEPGLALVEALQQQLTSLPLVG